MAGGHEGRSRARLHEQLQGQVPLVVALAVGAALLGYEIGQFGAALDMHDTVLALSQQAKPARLMMSDVPLLLLLSGCSHCKLVQLVLVCTGSSKGLSSR